MTTQRLSRYRTDMPMPLVGLKVHRIGDSYVLRSPIGNYEIDPVHQVIRVHVFPPVAIANGGPNAVDTYMLSGTHAGGGEITLVGLVFVGMTISGTYQFTHPVVPLATASPCRYAPNR